VVQSSDTGDPKGKCAPLSSSSSSSAVVIVSESRAIVPVVAGGGGGVHAHRSVISHSPDNNMLVLQQYSADPDYAQYARQSSAKSETTVSMKYLKAAAPGSANYSLTGTLYESAVAIQKENYVSDNVIIYANSIDYAVNITCILLHYILL
jgi:hypothetical protein